MTDEPTTPASDETTTEPTTPADEPKGEPATDRQRRRRRMIIGGVVAAAVVIVVLICVLAGLVVRSGFRFADRANADERRHERLTEACLELETRLNRVVPPGAAGGDPRRRADAIRDENVALRPLLTELDEMTTDRGHRGDRVRADWAGAWRQLVDARTAYADALDRQSTGEPAFWVAPRTPRGASVVSTLERRGPYTCEAAIRRLGHPDL